MDPTFSVIYDAGLFFVSPFGPSLIATLFHHFVAEMLRRFEHWHKTGLNDYFFVRSWIASRTGSTLLYFERPETSYFNPLVVSQGFFHHSDKSIDDSFRFDFGQPRSGGDLVYDICFGHFSGKRLGP